MKFNFLPTDIIVSTNGAWTYNPPLGMISDVFATREKQLRAATNVPGGIDLTNPANPPSGTPLATWQAQCATTFRNMLTGAVMTVTEWARAMIEYENQRYIPLAELGACVVSSSSYNVSPSGIISTVTGSSFEVPMSRMPWGIAVNTLTALFTPASHASLPAVFPSIALVSRPLATPTAAPTTLASVSYVPPSTMTAAQYGDGTSKLITLAPLSSTPGPTFGQPIPITTTDYASFFYGLQIVDESGAGSVTGNRYNAVAGTYAIPN